VRSARDAASVEIFNHRKMIKNNPHIFEALQSARAANTLADRLHDALRLAVDHEAKRAALPKLPDVPPPEIQKAMLGLVTDLIRAPVETSDSTLVAGVAQVVELWGRLQAIEAA
jgi:hypothetical protein